jgi:hypothetical protein
MACCCMGIGLRGMYESIREIRISPAVSWSDRRMNDTVEINQTPGAYRNHMVSKKESGRDRNPEKPISTNGQQEGMMIASQGCRTFLRILFSCFDRLNCPFS